MEKSREILFDLKKIVDVWANEANEEGTRLSGNLQYAFALNRCSIEITEFILKNIQDIRLIKL